MELLAPAGNWQALVAAIENGANAVYLGGPVFNARHSAENFTIEMIKQAVEYAHLRNVKVYITVNTLLHTHELDGVLDYVFELYNLDIDAVIVQDLGLLSLLRDLLPDLPLHASTQMTVHNHEGVNLLGQQGIKRVVLARELSLPEIKHISNNSTAELELFVHGALCYSYSGQCLFSSLVGGRSGNRGRCAQPCRLPYILYSERSGKQSLEGKYLLSPSDLNLIDYLSAIQESSVHSLKIEGRLKRPEYVAIVTRSYRQMLDHLLDGNGQPDSEVLKGEMAGIFNRDFSPGYFDPQVLKRLSTQRPNNRGVYIGQVISRNSDGRTAIYLQEESLSIGDGIEIWVSHGRNPAFLVERMEVAGRQVNSAAAGETITVWVDQEVAPHDLVFKTHDESLIASARASFENVKYPVVPVDVEVFLNRGEPLRAVYRTGDGHEAVASTVSRAEPARQKPLDESSLAEKLGRLGNTPYELRHLTLRSENSLIVPYSELNQVRRDAVSQLNELLVMKNKRQIKATDFYTRKKEYLAAALPQKRKGEYDSPQLTVMVSSIQAAEQALLAGADRIYLALEGLGTHKRPRADEVKLLRQQAMRQGCELVPALPRIRKPGDRFDYTKLVQDFASSQVMVGDLGAIHWCQGNGLTFWADYSLNILNPVSLDRLRKWGAQGVCVSPELNLNQLRKFPDLAAVELLIYGEVVLMVSQTCTLYETLENKPKCSQWCRREQYYIQDEKGYSFPVQGDADCRFYVFNSRTLAMLDDLPKLTALGPQALCLEMRRSSPQQVGQVVAIFRKALQNIAAGRGESNENLKVQLECHSPSPFTKCHYHRGVE